MLHSKYHHNLDYICTELLEHHSHKSPGHYKVVPWMTDLALCIIPTNNSWILLNTKTLFLCINRDVFFKSIKIMFRTFLELWHSQNFSSYPTAIIVNELIINCVNTLELNFMYTHHHCICIFLSRISRFLNINQDMGYSCSGNLV